MEFEGVKSKNFEQVLREVDKYDKSSEKEIRKNLSKYGAEKLLDDIKQGALFFKQFDSYKRVIQLIDYCRAYGVKAEFSPTVVRGLSYYNGSVFEVKAQGIKETIVAGGSYNFSNVQCTGISFGLERLSEIAKIKKEKEKTLIISLEQDRKAINISRKLREKGEISNIYYGKPSKALEYANSYGYEKVIFIGDKEVEKGKYKLKDMNTGKERFVAF
jgi:histidyl-tRNA synthetase